MYKGLLYNYFESKEDLLTEIILNSFNELVDVFDRNKDGFLSDEEFHYFVSEMFTIVDKNPQSWKLYFMLLAHPDILKLFEHKMRELFAPTMQVLIGYYKRKGVEKPENYAFVVFAAMDGIMLHYIMNKELFPKEYAKKLIIEKFAL